MKDKYHMISLIIGASLVAQNLLAMLKTQVQPLSQEDSLEKGMATHSSNPSRRIPWTEEPGVYSPWVPKELDMTKRLYFSFFPWLQAFLLSFLKLPLLFSNIKMRKQGLHWWSSG